MLNNTDYISLILCKTNDILRKILNEIKIKQNSSIFWSMNTLMRRLNSENYEQEITKLNKHEI